MNTYDAVPVKPTHNWSYIDSNGNAYRIPDHEAWQIENVLPTARGLVFHCFGDGLSAGVHTYDGITLHTSCTSAKCWATHKQGIRDPKHLDFTIVCDSEESLRKIAAQLPITPTEVPKI